MKTVMKINFVKTILYCAPFLVACSNDDSADEKVVSPMLPSTEIYVQGQRVAAAGTITRGSYTWPLHTDEGYETARFFIRSDATIPGYIDQSPVLYYGRISGGNNVGKVYSMYPYDRYNDRDLDYYEKDKKTGNNIGLFRYVYDPEGLKTQIPLMETPNITEILSDDRAVYEGAGNTEQVAKLDALLTKGEDYLSKHVLWYVVKEVGMQYGWHVDGIISDAEQVGLQNAIDPTKVPDNVELDIHQQEHKDWNEIKTSVHIRTDVESITINLPISEQNIVEQDDFAIRVYDFHFQEYVVEHTITHNAQGITIQITDIPASLIDALKARIGDGLTVEIHSYCREDENVWTELKNSTVTTGKACTVKGQITNAFNDEKVSLDN